MLLNLTLIFLLTGGKELLMLKCNFFFLLYFIQLYQKKIVLFCKLESYIYLFSDYVNLLR